MPGTWHSSTNSRMVMMEIVLLPLLEFVNVVSSEITSFDSTIMVMIANGTATMPATMPMAPADW